MSEILRELLGWDSWVAAVVSLILFRFALLECFCRAS